jgi:riboflavin synthase
MFTGIVSDIGEIVAAHDGNDLRRLAIRSAYPAAGIEIGASIACAGICLTAVAAEEAGVGSVFEVDVGPETLKATNAGTWQVGTRLNLERSLRMGDEMSGHLVSGHVDGLARIVSRTDMGETTGFVFAAPPALARFIAVKGSVCLDGTSLTVNEVDGIRFSCHLIPHTLKVTTWGERREGDQVNLEVDLVARYVARLAEAT